MAHRFHPDRLDWLLGEERRAVLPPEAVLNLLEIGPSDTVADIGSGPGYFTVPIAERTAGTVYAVDVEPRMLEALRERWPGGMPERVRTVLSPAHALDLPGAAADRMLYSLVLHEVEALDQALVEAKRVVKPAGKVVVVEWRPDATREGGPPRSERLDAGVLALRMRQHGFAVRDPLNLNEVHYALVGVPQ
ncbi:MAG: methyltransferase domain-containing protein [Kyrpidia sp.]|nr:methyltransferase domain-containing protein [Kyrpidia sp.]